MGGGGDSKTASGRESETGGEQTTSPDWRSLLADLFADAPGGFLEAWESWTRLEYYSIAFARQRRLSAAYEWDLALTKRIESDMQYAIRFLAQGLHPQQEKWANSFTLERHEPTPE